MLARNISKEDTQSCNCYYFCINDLNFCGIIIIASVIMKLCAYTGHAYVYIYNIIICYGNKKQFVGIEYSRRNSTEIRPFLVDAYLFRTVKLR